MKTSFAAVLVAGAISISISISACSKPQAPTLVPKEATVTDVSLTGFDMTVKLDAFNPNSFPISVRSLTADVIVNGQDLGTVTSSQPINLPSNAHTLVDAPLNVKWKGAVGLANLAQARQPIPYTVDGKAAVGGESLNVDVPFKLTGTITPQQIQAATQKSIQQALPALQGLLPALPAVPPR